MPGDPQAAPVTLHATAVSIQGAAALLFGASGAGKSGLALQMMGFGADLVGDDRVVVAPAPKAPRVCAAPHLSGRIEARGLGILHTAPVAQADVKVLVNLDVLEQDRLPPRRHQTVFGHPLLLLRKIDAPHFAAALVQLLAHGLDESA